MTATASPAPAQAAPASAGVRCPLLGCPDPRAGTITSWNAATGEWTATSPHRPGAVHLGPHPARAARWALQAHTDHAHPDIAWSPAVRVAVAAAAQRAGQAALGRAVDKVQTGTCANCQRRLTRVDDDAWLDDAGGDRCPEDAALCDRFCNPSGRPGPRWGPDQCQLCGGEGVIWQCHLPIPGRPGGKDGGRR